MKCECKECKFRGMELCEHRKLLDENAKIVKCLEEYMLKELESCDTTSERKQIEASDLFIRCRAALKYAKKIGGEE